MSYPTPFGKYQLLERINVGGMAEVFKAKAFGIDGFVSILAIKRILPNMAEDDEFITMFRDEAKVAVQLRHANIVHVYELARFENQYYIAMEYVAGKDLRQLLDRLRKDHAALPLAAAAFIAGQICEALDFAHNKTDPVGRPLNIIHRDVSPQNILLSYEGPVKITDFGIVKADNRGSRTQAGVLKGKFGYMSPEQVRGLEVDRRSDVFAVGILLYEMVTGERLFVGESDFSTLERVRNAEVPPPSEHREGLPAELEAVMLKALARDRDERYLSAGALGDDLQPFVLTDDGPFGGKRLAALLHDIYADDIARERARMADFMRLPAPAGAVPTTDPDQPPAPPSWEKLSTERTTIFAASTGPVAGARAPAAAPSPAPGPAASPPPAPAPAPSPPAAAALPARLGKLSGRRGPLDPWALRMLVGGLVLLLAGGTLYARLQRAYGTLVVTSVPTDRVNLLLDGEAIADHTPKVQHEVEVGLHTLLAKSAGYKDREIQVEVGAGTTAEVRVELQRAGGGQEELSLEVSSEPPAASVRVAGLPQGVTPLTLHSSDVSRPMVFEIGKAGFATQILTVQFAAGETARSMHVRLAPTEGPGAAHDASLSIRSRPDRAQVSLDGVVQGNTPLEIHDLDGSHVYELQVSREGFRPYREAVHFDGRQVAEVEAVLVVERSERPRRHVPPPAALPAGCVGSSGKISVMPVGVANCQVTVGKVPLGVAPLFKHEAPVGRCNVEVVCPNGKRFAEMRSLRPNLEERVVVKEEDWH